MKCILVLHGWIIKCRVLLVDWDMKLQQTMVEMFPLNSADAAYTKISGMLSTLGDPFTRIITPKVFLQLTLLFLESQSCLLSWSTGKVTNSRWDHSIVVNSGAIPL